MTVTPATLIRPRHLHLHKTPVTITPQRQAGTVPPNTRELGFKGRGMAGR